MTNENATVSQKIFIKWDAFYIVLSLGQTAIILQPGACLRVDPSTIMATVWDINSVINKTIYNRSS